MKWPAHLAGAQRRLPLACHLRHAQMSRYSPARAAPGRPSPSFRAPLALRHPVTSPRSFTFLAYEAWRESRTMKACVSYVVLESCTRVFGRRKARPPGRIAVLQSNRSTSTTQLKIMLMQF